MNYGLSTKPLYVVFIVLGGLLLWARESYRIYPNGYEEPRPKT